MNELNNLDKMGQNVVNEGFKEISNLTSLIGGETVKEEKALENLTSNIAGDVLTGLETTGGGLANLTFNIGGKAIEEEEALENLTAKITGNVLTDLETAGGGFANLTSNIGGEAMKEGKALENLTANIAVNVLKDFGTAEGDLANLTSNIGGAVIEEEKTLENLTTNIAGNVLTNLGKAGGSLTNLTFDFGGEAIMEGKALDNLTANIAENVLTNLETVGGGLANLTSNIGGGAIEEEKALKNLTAKIAGNVVQDLADTEKELTKITGNMVSEVGNVAGNLEDEIKNEGTALKDLTKNVADNVVGGIGNVASGLEDEVGSLFKGLGGWTSGSENNHKKIEKVKLKVTTLTPHTSRTGKSNIKSETGNAIKNEGKLLKDVTDDVTGNVFGGIGNVASGLKDEVGSLFKGSGGWTSGSGNGNKKTEKNMLKVITTTPRTQKTKKSDITSKIGNIFGEMGFSDDKISSMIVKTETNDFKSKNETNNNITLNTNKNEINNIIDAFGASNSEDHINVNESTMDLMSHLNNGVQDESKDIVPSNGFNSLFDNLSGYATNVENNAEKGSIQNIAVGSEKPFSILENKFIEDGSQNGFKTDSSKVEGIMSSKSSFMFDTTTSKTSENKNDGVFGGLFGGLKKIASKVSDEVENEKTMVSNVASSIGGTIDNMGKGKGSLFGDWSSSTSIKKSDSEEEKLKKKSTVGSNGLSSFFGMSDSKPEVPKKEKKGKHGVTSNISTGMGKAISGVENKISDASSKLMNMGGSLFGYRKKREIDMNFGNLVSIFYIRKKVV